MPDRPVAILITGSRKWNDEQKIREVLERFKGRDAVILYGCAPGADRIARDIAHRMSCESYGKPHRTSFRPFPADWDKHGRKAGPMRNQEMVDCLCGWRDNNSECHVFAFPLPDSRGTWDCVNRAKAAGFRVEVIR